MSQRVESYPQGLREMLGRGDPPQQLLFQNELTMPALEIAQFLLLQKRSTEFATEAVDGVGGQNTGARITVPKDELWLIHHFHVETPALETDQLISVTAEVQVNGLSLLEPFVNVVGTLMDVVRWGATSNYDLFLRPGDFLQARFTVITVGVLGTITLRSHVLFSRLVA